MQSSLKFIANRGFDKKITKLSIDTDIRTTVIFNNLLSFLALASAEIIMISIANTFVIIFQFGFIEIGVLLLIAGFFSGFMILFCIFSENEGLVEKSLWFATFLIGTELFYFIFIDSFGKFEYNSFLTMIVSIIGGIILTVIEYYVSNKLWFGPSLEAVQ